MSWKRVQGLALAGCVAAWAQSGWTPTGPYGGEAKIVRSVPRKAGLVIAATRKGLFFQSLDGGTSWTHRYFPGQLSGVLHALEVDPRYPDVWYAGMEAENARLSGVYGSKDGGGTWTPLPGLRGKAVWSLAIWPAGPDIVAAGTSEGVYLSRDGGESWAVISPANDPELRPVVSLAFHPADPRIIYAGTTHLPQVPCRSVAFRPPAIVQTAALERAGQKRVYTVRVLGQQASSSTLRDPRIKPAASGARAWNPPSAMHLPLTGAGGK